MVLSAALLLAFGAPVAQAADHALILGPQGYEWDGAAVDRTALRAAVEAAAAGDPSLVVRVAVRPLTPESEVFWATSLLRRAGVSGFSVGAVPAAAEGAAAPVEPAPVPVADNGQHLDAAPIAAPPKIPAGLRPFGEVQAGLRVSNADPEAPLGLALWPSRLGVWSEEAGGALRVEAGLHAAVEEGVARVEPGRMEVDWAPADRVHLRGGYTAPLLDDSLAFSALDGGFALVSPRAETLPVLAGLLPELGPALGLGAEAGRITGDLQLQQQGALPVLAGGLRSGEEGWAAVSGQVGLDGGPTVLRVGAGFDLGEWRIQAQALSAAVPGEEATAVAIEAAGACSLGGAGGALDDLLLTGRFGHFDPSLSTDDADAWMVGDLGLRALPALRGPAVLSLGVGYSLLLPINALLPIEHSLTVVEGLVF